MFAHIIDLQNLHIYFDLTCSDLHKRLEKIIKMGWILKVKFLPQKLVELFQKDQISEATFLCNSFILHLLFRNVPYFC